jgi:hypothetical protein
MQITNTPPWHSGLDAAGKSLEWLPTDSKENYKKLLQDPVHQRYFACMGWDQPGAITYNINSDGFRSQEFDSLGSCMIALGCSYTMGIGLPIETVWPSLVGQKLNLAVANLAWGGNSADTCFRLAEYWIPVLRPHLVAMLAPPPARLELLVDYSADSTLTPAEIFTPGARPMLSDGYQNEFLKHWFLIEENQRINQVKNCLAIQQLCHVHNIPCVIEHAADYMYFDRNEIGYARDYMHGGPIAHKKIAEKMLNDCTQK